MSNEMFVLVLAVGAAALAGWIHARFPGLAPERMGKTALHTGIAFVLLKLTPGFGESPMWIFAGVFLFVLPALVYALLCAIWMLRHAQTALGVSR
jgi:hypothetical protein